MTFPQMVQKTSQALTDGSTVEDLFEEYTLLEGKAERENFVMAVLGELAVAQARLKQSH